VLIIKRFILLFSLPTVLNWRCWLMQVDLYNDRKTVVVWLLFCCNLETVSISAQFVWTSLLLSYLLIVHIVFLVLAFSALTLLVRRQEEPPACKNWAMRCWCGYLSGVRCRLFAYGAADATVIPKHRHFLHHLNPDCFYLFTLPRLSWKRGH